MALRRSKRLAAKTSSPIPISKPTRKQKTKKSKPVNIDEPEVLLDITEIPDEDEDDIVDENEPETDLPDPTVSRKYPVKSKEQAAKHWKIYYERHYFEYLRKQCVRRIMLGYRLRYTTLLKYDLIDFYKKKTTPDNLAVFKSQEKFEKRKFQTPPRPYSNPIATRVMNAMASNQIGTTLPVDNIKILINPTTDNYRTVNFQETSENYEGVSVIAPPRTPGFVPTAIVDPVYENGKLVGGKYPYQRAVDIIMEIARNNSKSEIHKPFEERKMLSMKTRLSYKNDLDKLVKIFDCGEDLVGCFRVSQRVFKDKFRKAGMLGNAKGKNHMSLIAAVLPKNDPLFVDLMGKDRLLEFYQIYNNEMKISKEQQKEKTTTATTLPYKELVRVLDKIEKEYKELKKTAKANPDKSYTRELKAKNLELVLIALYTLFPSQRDNYGVMKVVKNIPVDFGPEIQKDPIENKVLNYYGTKNKVFCFQNFKTATKVNVGGQKRFQLKRFSKRLGNTKRLMKILDMSLKDYDREWIYPKRRGKGHFETLSTKIRQLTEKYGLKAKNGGKSVGTRELRHIYITHMYVEKNPPLTEDEQKTLADAMAHTTRTAQNVYLRVLEGEDV